MLITLCFRDVLEELKEADIKSAMLELEKGVHDIWVQEHMISLYELYTYQHNQDKLKSIESAKILVSQTILSIANLFIFFLLYSSWRIDIAL